MLSLLLSLHPGAITCDINYIGQVAQKWCANLGFKSGDLNDALQGATNVEDTLAGIGRPCEWFPYFWPRCFSATNSARSICSSIVNH